MKSCPACQRTYDDTQNFCLDDGATLVSVSQAAPGSAWPAENLPHDRSSAQTEVLHGGPTAGQYQRPTSPPPYTPPPPPYPPPPVQKPNRLPWFIGGGLALVVAIVGIFLATRSSDTGTPRGGPSPIPMASPGRTSSTPTRSGTVYNSPDGRFTITLPPGFSPFTSQKQSQGAFDLNILQSETPTGACVLGYSDFPEASFEGRTPKRMLEDGRDGALRNINATLEKQEDVKVQGRDGLLIYGSTVQGGKSIYVRFQFILDRPRAYQIGYLAYKREDLDKPETEAYFESFRIK